MLSGGKRKSQAPAPGWKSAGGKSVGLPTGNTIDLRGKITQYI